MVVLDTNTNVVVQMLLSSYQMLLMLFSKVKDGQCNVSKHWLPSVVDDTNVVVECCYRPFVGIGGEGWAAMSANIGCHRWLLT